MSTSYEIPEWSYAYGGPCGTGVIKSKPDDFIVRENLAFEPEGSGEHVFLQITKTGQNTEFVARELARFAGVRQRDIGYAGLKDRHAVTTQWFSVWLPGRDDPYWNSFESENIKINKICRHARKLKRGVLTSNDFELTIRQWTGDRKRLEFQLNQIKQRGIPNYFGEQRFGYQGQNVNKAVAMFADARVKAEQRSLYLSAVRAYLFNQLLARRIQNQTWNRALPGDALVIDQTHSWFLAEELDDSIKNRIATGSLHPTGMLGGKGSLPINQQALEIEQAILEQYPELAQGLIAADVELDRRSLRVNIQNLTWEFLYDDVFKLSFSLPAGSYATALLREVVAIRSD